MGANRHSRQISARSAIIRQSGDDAASEAAAPSHTTADARVISLHDGSRWLVTVVARLVSEDIVTGTETARLVIRFECLSHPHRSARVATLRARSLHAVDDETLRSQLPRRWRMPEGRRDLGA